MSINPNNIRKKLAKNILADGFEPIIDLNKSYGSYLVDQRNGDEYLDMFSMYASGAVGYNHPYILEHKDILGDIAINKTTINKTEIAPAPPVAVAGPNISADVPNRIIPMGLRPKAIIRILRTLPRI